MSTIELPPKKRVGHLTLLRAPKSLTPQQFNALAFDERLAMIRATEGRQKYNLLVEARDAEALVRRLPAQEIYLLIKELGKDDVPELLANASTEQLTTFFDLDCWERDHLSAERVLEWFALLLETGEEKILQTVEEIDFNLLTGMLKKQVTVLRGPEDYLDDDALAEAVQRDGGYELEYRDPEGAKIIGGLLNLILRRSPESFPRLLESVRGEQEILLEEECYHQRNGRLQDLGFPDPEEALSIYAWLDPQNFDPAPWRKRGILPGEETEAPGFVLALGASKGLLAEILSEGVESETAWELSFLLNRVMAADGVDVGDSDAVRDKMREVHRYLNLALEHLAGADVEKAAELFRSVYLQILFRLGFSLTLELQRRARALSTSPIVPYLDGPFRALLEASLLRKPQFFEGMEQVTRGGTRPFGEVRELRLACEWFDRLEVQHRLFTGRFPFHLPAPEELDLSGCSPEDPDDVALSDFFLTALANRLLGREFLPAPLAPEEIVAVHGMACAEGKLSADLRKETEQWLESLEPGGAAFGSYCLDLWQDEFCAIQPEELDPRFVGGLIVKSERE